MGSLAQRSKWPPTWRKQRSTANPWIRAGQPGTPGTARRHAMPSARIEITWPGMCEIDVLLCLWRVFHALRVGGSLGPGRVPLWSSQSPYTDRTTTQQQPFIGILRKLMLASCSICIIQGPICRNLYIYIIIYIYTYHIIIQYTVTNKSISHLQGICLEQSISALQPHPSLDWCWGPFFEYSPR